MYYVVHIIGFKEAILWRLGSWCTKHKMSLGMFGNVRVWTGKFGYGGGIFGYLG